MYSTIHYAATPVRSVVIFGDSMSDVGNTTHLLKTLSAEEDPAYVIAPLKHFVLNKMRDFAAEHYVPQSVLSAGINTVTVFFDYEIAPYIVHLIAQIKLIPILPGAPYWQDRFSNGPVWNEYLMPMLGIDQNNQNTYNNKAFGGSWAVSYEHQLTVWNLIRYPIQTIKSLIVGKLVPPSLGLTVQAYLLEHPQVNPDAVYFIFTGGNDYLNALRFNSRYDTQVTAKYIDNVLHHIDAAVNKLVNAGAKQIIIMGLPYIGQIPKFVYTADKDILNNITEQHNQQLQLLVTQWKQQYAGVDWLYVDTHEYLARALINPAFYGFTNVSDACIDVVFPMFHQLIASPFANNYVLYYTQILHHRHKQLASSQHNYHVCTTPEDYLFWDEIHPTTRAHQLLAVEICTAMNTHGYEVNCMPQNK